MVRQRPSGSVAYLTTMIYTHVLNRGPAGVCSPADRMGALIHGELISAAHYHSGTGYPRSVYPGGEP